MGKCLTYMALLVFTVCSENPISVTTPTPLPPTQEPSTPYMDVRADTEPDLYNLVGVTAFALALRDEGYIHSFISHVQSAGYNTLIVGSETGGWKRYSASWLPAGPLRNTPEALANVRRLLRVTAQYPNLHVQLISSFADRSNDHKGQLDWARKLTSLVRKEGYRHVTFRAMNEPYMANWSVGELLQLIQILQESGRPVTVDQPAEGGKWKYDRTLMGRVDYLDMHPRRNPDLSSMEIQNLGRLNGTVFLSETTAYASDADLATWPQFQNNALIYLNGTGTEEERRREAVEYKDRVKAERDIMWAFHSIQFIMCETLPWIPRY